MAISDDWTVDYSNRRIYHSSGTTVYSVNELYSYLMNVFDESGTIDDTIPMTAQTPTAYTLTNGWFLDYTSTDNHYSHRYLNGGSLKTSGWDATTSNVGIRLVTLQAGGYVNCVLSDIGREVGYSGGAPGDTGTLLAYNNTTRQWWVRVDDTGDTFANTATTLDLDDGTGTGTGTIAVGATNNQTGENIWANPFTLGTIESETQLYLVQNGSAISSWWSTGHIDILALVKEAGTEIDTGLITFFARQYSKLFDHYVADLTDGSRTPIPLATSGDTNNSTGYVLLNCSGGSGTFTSGEVIGNHDVRASATALGVITNVAGTGSDPDLTVYLIGNLNAIADTDTIHSYVTTAQADVDTVSDTGPLASPSSTLTIGFGGIMRDLSNGDGSKHYSVELDLQNTITVAQLYERVKYLTRRGQTTDIDTESSQTIIGQSYTGVGDYYIPYDTGTDGGSPLDNPFTEGETITATGGFSAIITSKHDRGTNEGFLIVRNVRGTIPIDNTLLTGGSSGHTAQVDTNTGLDPVAAINQFKQSPFGTFAGGKFFGARGVFLANVPNSDATKYELIDSEGVRRVPPNNVPVEVTGVAYNSQCYVADSVPTVYLNTEATTSVSGSIYKASATHTYSTPISVTVRAREMGYLPFETTGTISSSGLSVTAVWLVDPNWKLVVSGVNITFANATSRITRAAGSFTADGWIEFMSQVTVEGSASNDGTYTLNSAVAVAATYITISGATLTDEGPVAGVTLTFTRRAVSAT